MGQHAKFGCVLSFHFLGAWHVMLMTRVCLPREVLGPKGVFDVHSHFSPLTVYQIQMGATPPFPWGSGRSAFISCFMLDLFPPAPSQSWFLHVMYSGDRIAFVT